MKKALIAGGLVLAVVVIAALAFSRPSVQDAIVRRIATQQMEVRNDLLDYDGLRVVMCGTASPMPHPARAQACVMVITGKRLWLVDAGARSSNNLARWRIPYDHLAGVLLTHFHSDHIGDLGEFRLQSWVLGRPGKLPVYGPAGVERVVAGFNEAYAIDDGYRFAHHGASVADPAIADLEAHTVATGNPQDAPSAVVLEEDGLRITAFTVDHHPVHPAVGYRFDYEGRSVVISGDTAPTDAIVEMARGADVLLHEAQANHMVDVAREVAESKGLARRAQILADIPSYHTSPTQAAELAKRAGVRLLGLYHLTPPPPNAAAERIFLRGMDDIDGPSWMLTEDGTQFDLPAGSVDVAVSSIE
jgi:ribonuclease Z